MENGCLLPQLTHDEVSRYSRHLILDDVGVVGQRRLKASKVLCIGAGGLGSPALMYLTAAGVGTLGIVDADTVDVSNLQRQIVHSTLGVGRAKVESASERLREINPFVQVVAHRMRLDVSNALELIASYDLVVDGSDNFPTRYLVNDACVILKKPLVYGAVQKFEGQVSLFNYRGGPNYRDLFPEPPPPGSVPSCAEGGVLGVLPGLVGTLQATEAIKVLLGKGETLSGRLLIYDAMRIRFHEIQLKPRQNMPPITCLVDYAGFCGAVPPVPEGPAATAPAAEGFSRLSVIEVQQRFSDGWTPFVLDVRSAAEAAIASLQNDMQHPHRTVARIVGQLPPDRDLLVYCKAGGRSATACTTLAVHGFDRIFNLEGGITAWATHIDTSLPTY